MRLLLLGPPAVLVRSGSDPEWQTCALGPKSTALLAFLAQGPRGGTLRRDSLVGMLWPESSHRRARAALRQLLTGLRSSVGADVIQTQGKECVGLSPDSVWCDAWAFEDHLRNEEFQEAIELYRGEFAEGLFVKGCPALERWLDARRRRYLDAACDAAWARTRRLCATGELRAAVATARFAVRRKPLNEPGLRQFLRVLASAGDSAAAVREYRSFVQRMESELGLRPHEETEAIVTAIRDGQARPKPSALFDDPDGPGSAVRS